MRETFVIYKEWDDAIRKAPDDVQLELYHALMDFVSTGEKPKNLTWQAEMIICIIEKQVNKIIEKYNASIENGKKGGRPKTTQDVDIDDKDSNSSSDNLDDTMTVACEPNSAAQNLENIKVNSKNLDVLNKKDEKPNDVKENLIKPNINQIKPNANLEEPKSKLGFVGLFDKNLNDYDYVNVFSQSNNTARPREVGKKSEELRYFWKNKFADFWTFGITPERDKLGFEVIDVILEAFLQTRTKERLLFNRKKYSFNEFYSLIDKLDCDDFFQIVWSLQNQNEIKNRPYYILGALLNKVTEKGGS